MSTQNIQELIKALEGAEKALKKSMPFLPPDKEGIFVGEWLDEVKQTLQNFKSDIQAFPVEI